METREIRLQNLLELSRAHRKIIDFCETIEMNPSYFSQIKSGKKAIGDDIARKVERHLGLQRGYLDTPKGAGQTPDTSAPQSDVMATAYSIQSLPDGLRDQLTRLVHQIAAHVGGPNNRGADVQPFTVIEKQKDKQSAGHSVQKARKRR